MTDKNDPKDILDSYRKSNNERAKRYRENNTNKYIYHAFSIPVDEYIALKEYTTSHDTSVNKLVRKLLLEDMGVIYDE